ncbi:MAG TPA: hypothetical protein ENJ25_01520 [Firmicutes bacterium]|nr:hypothetical protein [Bacillota bacterium]
MNLKHSIYIFLLALFINGSVFSGVLSVYNHPEIKWNYLESGNFTVYYPSNDSVDAQKVLDILIPFSDTVNFILGAPRGHTDIVLNNYDEMSNGMANSVGDIININTHPYYTVTTGNIPWLRRVARHEFSHIATYKALTPINWTPLRILTMSTIPQWFYEGIAQYCAETMDDNRKMFIRDGVKNKTLLDFNFLDQTAINDLIDGRYYYEEGHGIIEMKMKEDSIYLKRILKTQSILGLFLPFHLSYIVATSDFAYDDFVRWVERERASIRDDSSPSYKKMETPFVYMKGFKEKDSIAVYSGFNDLDIPVNRLVYRKNGKTHGIDNDVGAYFDLSPDGENIVYSKTVRDRHGTILEDIVLFKLNNRKHFYITHNSKSTNPVFYNDSTIIYTEFVGTKGELVKYNIYDNKKTVLIRPDSNFEYYVTPTCYGGKIAYEKIGKTRYIRITDGYGNVVDSIYSSAGESRHPFFADDTTLYFTGYFCGRPEIYRYNMNEKKYYRETKAFSGHFQPFFVKDTLYFIDYHGRKGFSLEYKDNINDTYEVRIKEETDNVPLAEYMPITDIKKGKYNPFTKMKMVGFIPIILPEFVDMAGNSIKFNPRFVLAGLFEDPLLKNVVYGFIGSNLFDPSPTVYLNYINSTLYPTVSINYLRIPFIWRYNASTDHFTYYIEESAQMLFNIPVVLSNSPEVYGGFDLSVNYRREDTLRTIFYDGRFYAGKGNGTYNDDILPKKNIAISVEDKYSSKKLLCPENFNLLNIEFNLNKPMNRRVVNHLIYSFYYATGVISRTSLFIDKRKYGGFPDYDIPQRVEVGTDYIVGRNLGKGLSFITLPYINQLSFGLFSDNYGFYKISNRDIKFRSFIGVRSNVKISYYYLNLLVEGNLFYDINNKNVGYHINVDIGINGI